jgi:carboxyl-terminal processing protease
MIVTTRGRGGVTLQEHRASRGGSLADLPLIVLIDGASASAAEIVAGALQDHGRALLVGSRTFGKGSVQNIIELGGGYGLKLTVALYYTPQGKAIQAEGVTPDVIIASRQEPPPDQETAAIAAMPREQELPGHLRSEDLEPLLGEDEPEIDDYQLRIAFQLVRGLARSGRAEGKR